MKKLMYSTIITRNESIYDFSDSLNGNGTPAWEQFKAKKTIHAKDSPDGQEVYIPYHAIALAEVSSEETQDVAVRDAVCDGPITCDDIHFFMFDGDFREVHDGESIAVTLGSSAPGVQFFAATTSTVSPDDTSSFVPLTGETSSSQITVETVEPGILPVSFVMVTLPGSTSATNQPVVLKLADMDCSITVNVSLSR